MSEINVPYPQYGWNLPEEIPENFRKDSGNALRAFPGIPLESTAGTPKPYNSRHLKPPEHFQNCLPPSTSRGASFFRSGSGEGLSELVMEFLAVLRVSLNEVYLPFCPILAALKNGCVSATKS